MSLNSCTVEIHICLHCSIWRNYLKYEQFIFSVIACKPTFPAYLSCLLPTDQVFDFDELEYHFQVANRTEDMPAEKKGTYFIYARGNPHS